MLSDLEHHDMPHKPHGLPANAEWPIDQMAAMPLHTGMVMVRTAAIELPYAHGVDNLSLIRQHRNAVQEADLKWRIEESRLATEAAIRFRIRALGWAAMGIAFGGGSVIVLLVENLLLA